MVKGGKAYHMDPLIFTLDTEFRHGGECLSDTYSERDPDTEHGSYDPILSGGDFKTLKNRSRQKPED